MDVQTLVMTCMGAVSAFRIVKVIDADSDLLYSLHVLLHAAQVPGPTAALAELRPLQPPLEQQLQQQHAQLPQHHQQFLAQLAQQLGCAPQLQPGQMMPGQQPQQQQQQVLPMLPAQEVPPPQVSISHAETICQRCAEPLVAVLLQTQCPLQLAGVHKEHQPSQRHQGSAF
jgi:hypothetical protein